MALPEKREGGNVFSPLLQKIFVAISVNVSVAYAVRGTPDNVLCDSSAVRTDFSER